MVAAMASVSLHAAPKSKSAVNLVDNYEVVQSAVPEGGYVVAVYADGWDKYSKKLMQKLLKDAGVVKALDGCAVISYGVPNLSTDETNKERADKLGKLKWVGAHTYPAFLMYDKNGRHYATVLIPYADRNEEGKIAQQLTAARQSLKKQNELLEKAKGEEGLAKAKTLGQSAEFDNINRPDNIVNQIKAVDPDDKSGYVRRYSFNGHAYAIESAGTKDWRATLEDCEKKMRDKAYTVEQRQGLYATAIGLIRRHGDLKDQKKLPRYLSEMEKLDPDSPLGRSADHAAVIWISKLSCADGWSPSVLPKDDTPAEIEGPYTIKSAGTYEVTFTYSRGAHQLEVHGVRLYDGDRKVAEDMHVGTMGIKHNKNVYTLVVPDKVKSPRVEAIFNMPKNRDSYGKISIKKK